MGATRGVPAEAIEKEKSIYLAQMENTGKPANVLDKIIEGKLGSFYSQFVLLEQPSIRDNNVSISQLIALASAKTGENIQVNRVVRFPSGTRSNADVHPSPFLCSVRVQVMFGRRAAANLNTN